MPHKLPVVPASWPLDVSTLLRAAERSGSTSATSVDHFLAALRSFVILIDDETEYRTWHDTLALARAHRLPLAKAAYLELAHRTNLPLATVDSALTRAAARAGVPLFTP